MQKLLTSSVVLTTVLAVSPVGALAVGPSADYNLSTPGTDRTLVLPEAADNAPVISLGSGVDPVSGGVVKGYAIIHYKSGFGHKPGHGDGKPGGGEPDASSCYGFLAKGAKWKTIEPWVVNPSNLAGLDGGFVLANLGADVDKWEVAAGADILGAGSSTSDVLVADTSSPDGINEVYFADVSSPGAIAVTIVWGYFSGPPFARELIEWDMVFNDVDFDWSSSGAAGAMDFENIATHELGHSVGLADLYESVCADETMYGYAANGETKKRDLNAGDITGVSKLY